MFCDACRVVRRPAAVGSGRRRAAGLDADLSWKHRAGDGIVAVGANSAGVEALSQSDATDTLTGDVREAARASGVRIPATAAGLVAAAAVALYFVFDFAERERQRDLRTWQTRLAIIADSRAAAVTA